MVLLRLRLPDYLLSTCGHRQEHFQFVVASVTSIVSYAVNLCLWYYSMVVVFWRVRRSSDLPSAYLFMLSLTPCCLTSSWHQIRRVYRCLLFIVDTRYKCYNPVFLAYFVSRPNLRQCVLNPDYSVTDIVRFGYNLIEVSCDPANTHNNKRFTCNYMGLWWGLMSNQIQSQ